MVVLIVAQLAICAIIFEVFRSPWKGQRLQMEEAQEIQANRIISEFMSFYEDSAVENPLSTTLLGTGGNRQEVTPDEKL